MTTAFQANAFQRVTLAFQIDTTPTPPTDMVGTDPMAGSPGIQWVSMEDVERLRKAFRRRETVQEADYDERAAVRQIMDEVIRGPAPIAARGPSMPLVEPPQEAFDPEAWRIILAELRDIQARAQDEDDIEVLLLTMH